MQVDREPFYRVEDIVREAGQRIRELGEKGERVDYLTFVSSGEPTLDVNLGKEIEALKSLGLKVAVITNSSLMWQEEVREELLQADWVSLKVDTVNSGIWQRINRPCRKLRLEDVLEGVVCFSNHYGGFLATETMLIQELNDGECELEKVARFLAELKPDRAYISVPVRPPAEEGVFPSGEHEINTAYQIFGRMGLDSECLTACEGDEFSLTGNVEVDLLNIMAVHPMRKAAVERLLEKYGRGWDIIDRLLNEQKIVGVEYQDEVFYLRKLSR